MTAVDPLSDRTWRYWTPPTFVTVDGVRTAYRRDGSGAPLLFLHGVAGSRQWAPVHRELAASFDVIAPEHPGFGDSDRHIDQDSFADMALHYDAFLRAVGVERPHLVGVSLGAWIAADLAITYPERFASLTLVTPFGVRIPDEPLFDTFRLTPETRDRALFNGRQDAVADQLVQQGGLDDVLHGIAEDAVAAALHWNPRYDHKLDRRLSRITIPTLVVSAGDDRFVGNRQAPRFAELIGDSTLHTLAGPGGGESSHGLAFEQPAELAALIAAHAGADA